MAYSQTSPVRGVARPFLVLLFLAGILSNGSDAKEDEKQNYGPPPSQARGTLFQWSYGTTFSGGPDLDERLVADRPDFTESSVTVGRGVAQLEMGYAYTIDRNNGERTGTSDYPQSLLRYGVFANWLELRAGWDWNDAVNTTSNFRQSGANDLYLGVKIALTPQEGILPEMALIPQMSVPTGSGGFSAGESLPGLNWVYSWEVNDLISISGGTQFNRAVDEVSNQAYEEWAQSISVGYSLTKRFGAFTECYALFPHSAETAKPQYYFDGGFTYSINKNFQWDIEAGMGLNEAANDFFAGTGFAVRFY